MGKNKIRGKRYIEKVCEGCDKKFEVRDTKKYRKQRFCSRKCADENRHTEESRKKISRSLLGRTKVSDILVEGVDYTLREKESGNREVIRLRESICVVCGAPFKTPGSRKTCSDFCLDKLKRRKKPRNCIICGKKLETNKKVCSDFCYHRWKARGRKFKLVERNGKTVRKYSKVNTCVICKREFITYCNPKTCSLECQKVLKSKRAKNRVESLSLEEFEKFKKIFSKKGGFGKRTKSKCGVICRSKVEARLLNFLTHLNVEFEYEPPIPEVNKLADVLITGGIYKKGLYIEIDGLHRGKDDSKNGWNGKLGHYKKLLKEKKIDQFLILTPKNYKKKIMAVLQSGI